MNETTAKNQRRLERNEKKLEGVGLFQRFVMPTTNDITLEWVKDCNQKIEAENKNIRVRNEHMRFPTGQEEHLRQQEESLSRQEGPLRLQIAMSVLNEEEDQEKSLRLEGELLRLQTERLSLQWERVRLQTERLGQQEEYLEPIAIPNEGEDPVTDLLRGLNCRLGFAAPFTE